MGKAVAVTVLLAGFFAHVASADEGEVIGKVRALYEQPAPGVFVAQSLNRRLRSEIMWADMDLGPRVSGERFAIVQLDGAIKAEAGDLLMVRLESPKSARGTGVTSANPPMRQASRAVAVKARWFTEEAQRFASPPATVVVLTR